MKKIIFAALTAFLLIGSGCGDTSTTTNQQTTKNETNTHYQYLWLFPKEYTMGEVYDTSNWTTLKQNQQKFNIKTPKDMEVSTSVMDPIIEGAENGLLIDFGLFVINVQDNSLGLSATEVAEQLWPSAEIKAGSENLWHPIAGELIKKYPDLDLVYINDTSDPNEYEGLQLNKELCVNKNGKLYFFIINKEGIITTDGYENSLKFVVSQMQTFEFIE